MNNPIRRLAVVAGIMFCALLASTSWIQFVQAAEIRDKPGNRRSLLENYGRPREAILVDGNPVAQSQRTDGELTSIRRYPDGPRYAHVTGYYSFLYGAGGGLERTEDGLLNGQSDKLLYRRLGDLLTGHQPTGVSVDLTINPKAQAKAAELLGGQRGAVVALDPKTGAVLALVSRPTYDPNVLAGHNTDAVAGAWQRLNADPGAPLKNRAIAGDLYPPGSTLKVITAAAALSSGRYTAQSAVPGGSALRLPGTNTPLVNHGRTSCGGDQITLAKALEVSCNVSFGAVGMDLGAKTLEDQAAKFGFTREIGIPMPATKSTLGAVQDKAQLARAAIGQQSVRVTPLQMALVAAGIANGGSVMQPHLVKQTRGAGLDVLDRTAPGEFDRATSPEVAAAVGAMMEKVVQSGTGTRAHIPGIRVAGKTGTAEHGTAGGGQSLKAHAWFIGYAPADNPQIAVAVVVENGGDAGSEAGGGKVAAPIAREVMKAVIAR